MIKKYKKDNALFLLKRKSLVSEMRKKGINRAGSDALFLLEDYILRELDHVFNGLKEEMVTNGRKTLKKEDVQNFFEKMKKEEEAWDV